MDETEHHDTPVATTVAPEHVAAKEDPKFITVEVTGKDGEIKDYTFRSDIAIPFQPGSYKVKE